MNNPIVTRRELLRATMMAGGLLLVGWDRLIDVAQAKDPYPSGKLLGTLDFISEDQFQMEVPAGLGLDGRLFTDLSKLTADSLIIPTDRFYIRTRCPDLIDYKSPWTINVAGLVEQPLTIKIDELTAKTRPMGVHLMECSGNRRSKHFSMLSACQWSGVPIAEILSQVKLKSTATQVLVGGFDGHWQPSFTSRPGADWIFTLAQLAESKAFLATQMNGAALTPDHGYPVRLLVPGWYGCTCVKWVNRIMLVDREAPSTSQMIEFAARTHQHGVPTLARNYQAAIIDQSAMPIRVEKWLVDGKITYNVVGIMWGGRKKTTALGIRFNPTEAYLPVEQYEQLTNETWTLWSHKWTPAQAGLYRIQLKLLDPTIRTRRLNTGFYMRAVNITESS